MSRKKYCITLIVLCVFSFLVVPVSSVAEAAPPFGTDNFQNLWQYSDKLVDEIPNAGRGYTWGPNAFATFQEPYKEGTNGKRLVEYFDKSRMELSPDGQLVTNGLLTKELVTGLRQDGDNTFMQLQPSTVQVAGDDNSNGANSVAPVYASFKDVVTFNPNENRAIDRTGQLANLAINRAGTVTTITPNYQIKIGAYEPVLGHNVPQIFLDFENQVGQVWDNTKNSYVSGHVYTDNPIANVFGYPVSEPYWAKAVVSGQERDVLIQLFERRVLTYTPANPKAFQVEMGNIGQHYFRWRYGNINAPTAVSKGDSNNHYGVIVTGLDTASQPAASLQRVFNQTGAQWWYQYDPILPDQTNAQQVFLIKDLSSENSENYQFWLQFLLANGAKLRHSYWLIGNEPNVPGQDDTKPEDFARTLHSFSLLVKTIDPEATLIGPNVLNWDYTCNGCAGYTSGQTWLQQMQTAYRNLYHAALPFDAYSLHTYSLDWAQLPLINQKRDAAQIEDLRSFLDADPETQGKPIWITEFGVIWGYDGIDWKQDSNGNWKASPKGQLRTDLITNYLNDSLNWLDANAARLNIGRWFVYTSYGLPEPYADTFSGISLLDGTSPQANSTNYGVIYRQHSQK